jgi:hypothetical protein
LLGASNLTRSFPTIVATLRQTWSEPIEFMVAMGHGRSYWQHSSVLGRKIPGIFPCALWRDLQAREKLSTTALVTDIGNDFLYGATPERLLEGVKCCLDRLAEAEAATIVTQLPLESIETLGERRFRIFRRLLFPRSAITLDEAKRYAREMNSRLAELADGRNLSVISVSAKWYGLDPIHIKRLSEREAWPALLAGWRANEQSFALPRPSLLTIAYLASLAPLEWSQFGLSRRAAQPSGRFHDGTTISLY